MDSLKNRKQFKFYRSYFDIISELENDTDKLNYLISILEFQFNGIEIPLQGMAKFAFKSQKHSLDRQLKGFIDATSPDTPIVTPIETPLGGADSIPIEHTPIGIINNEEERINKEDKKKKEGFDFKNALIEYGFKPELVSDWLIVRKNKKSINTITAFNNFVSQIEKSKKDKNEILEHCVVKCWVSFNHNWKIEESNNSQKTETEILSEERWFRFSKQDIEFNRKTKEQHNSEITINGYDSKYILK